MNGPARKRFEEINNADWEFEQGGWSWGPAYEEGDEYVVEDEAEFIVRCGFNASRIIIEVYDWATKGAHVYHEEKIKPGEEYLPGLADAMFESLAELVIDMSGGPSSLQIPNFFYQPYAQALLNLTKKTVTAMGLEVDEDDFVELVQTATRAFPHKSPKAFDAAYAYATAGEFPGALISIIDAAGLDYEEAKRFSSTFSKQYIKILHSTD